MMHEKGANCFYIKYTLVLIKRSAGSFKSLTGVNGTIRINPPLKEF